MGVDLASRGKLQTHVEFTPPTRNHALDGTLLRTTKIKDIASISPTQIHVGSRHFPEQSGTRKLVQVSIDIARDSFQ
ncbi:family transcriptional regulator [Lasius niger]|uniref:Family transcriptional regulator n=1 Tax=Lasius niger TaxID=67767 RepID=A0A0J7KGC6_LASNI|nr:family transcriptional regulator [Lasius niger]